MDDDLICLLCRHYDEYIIGRRKMVFICSEHKRAIDYRDDACTDFVSIQNATKKNVVNE